MPPSPSAQRPVDRQAFFDSSGFFAVGVQGDANFEQARRIMARLRKDHVTLTTTIFVVAEAHALFLSRAGRDPAARFLRGLSNTSIEIVHPTAGDESRAFAIVERYTDKSFSLTDALSFAVMERLGISTAFTFDRDFEQFGFAFARP